MKFSKVAILAISLMVGISSLAEARGSFSSGGGGRSFSGGGGRSFSSGSSFRSSPSSIRTTTTTTSYRSSYSSGGYGYRGMYVHPMGMYYGGWGMGYGYSNGLLTGIIIGNMLHPQGTQMYTGPGDYANNALLYPDGRVVDQTGHVIGMYVNGQFSPIQNGPMVAQQVPQDAGQYVPQQQQIQQRHKNSAHQAGKNKGARRQAGGVEPLRIEGGILAGAGTQQEYGERHNLEQDADEDSAIGKREQGLVVAHAADHIENEGRCNDQHHQQHEPSQVRDDHEQTHAALQKHFRLFLRVPGNYAQSAPVLEAGQNSKVDPDRKQAGGSEKRFVVHFVLDQEHQCEGEAEGARGIGEHGQGYMHV